MPTGLISARLAQPNETPLKGILTQYQGTEMGKYLAKWRDHKAQAAAQEHQAKDEQTPAQDERDWNNFVQAMAKLCQAQNFNVQ